VKTETERTVLSPESRAALERGTQLSTQQAAQVEKAATAQKAQTSAQAELERDNNRVDSLTAQYQARVAEEAAIREELAQARFREANEKAQQKIEAAQKRVDAANANAQKGYFADQSTGYKIIQALLTYSSVRSSLALGQDPNDSPFMRATRDAVERDKERKMMEVRASKEFLEAARRGPEEARQFLQDARADIEAGTARQLQITLKKAEALKASRKLDPKILETNIAAANAEADAKVLQAQQGLVDQELRRGALGNRKVTTTAAPLTAAQMKASQPDNRLLVRWNGRDYSTRNLTDGTQLRKKAGATNSLVQQLDKLEGLIKQYDATPLTYGEGRAKIEAAIGRLTGGIKESKELGALDKGVQTLVASMISDPTSLKAWLLKGGQKGSLAGIQALRQEAVSDMENSLTAQGNEVQDGEAAPANELAAMSDGQLEYAVTQAIKTKDPALAELRQELKRRQKAK
jgi:hypothetical protein